jgi:hypothetical protein
VLFPENKDDGFIVDVAEIKEECSTGAVDEKLVVSGVLFW